MRRILGTAAAVAVLALVPVLTGCGDDSSEPTATDREPTGTTSPAGGVDYQVVAIEHATAAGGQVDQQATLVGPGGDTGAILAELTDPQFRELVEQRITFSRAAGDLYAAVVSVGCDVPPGVTVVEAGGGYEIVPDKVADPIPECFAPVTTVAVVAVT
jgi:hypothetical protein